MVGSYQNYVTWSSFFFFFQAEDGIRDTSVTGVQTCALPISTRGSRPTRISRAGRRRSYDRSDDRRAGSDRAVLGAVRAGGDDVPRARRDGALDGGRRRAAVGTIRAAQSGRWARVRLLHEHGEPQGVRAPREPV